MDFGIARSGEESSLTMTGMTLGSLSYMSPEQVTGEGIDARSDLYSVGVSLYEMVTGRRPFQAQSDYSIMAAQVKEVPKPPMELMPGIPETLNEIILIAIAKDPAQRFQSADAFRNALSSVVISTATAMSTTPSMPTAVPASSVTSTPPGTPSATVAATQAMMPPPAATTVSVPQVPAPTPIPTPAPMPALVASSGHRGLYMTLGALIVLAGLLVAGIYVPRYRSTHADPLTLQPAPSKERIAQPSQPPMSAPAASPLVSDSNVNPSPAPAPSPVVPEKVTPASEKVPLDKNSTLKGSVPVKPPTKPSGTMRAASKPSRQSSEMSPMDAPSSPPQPSADTANLDEMEHEIDQLSNRAAAVNNSLDRLQQQQSAAGYGLRGDMAARQSSMKNNLSKAQDAVEHGDAARAKRYMTMAEGDVEALERFLGH
jgi:serine/threonine-protein kinase